jgi:soluble lytic murein transglycosylase
MMVLARFLGVSLLLPILVGAAAVHERPSSAVWQEALERVKAKDHRGAGALLDDLRRRDDFDRAHEAGFLYAVVLHRQERWREAADALEATAAQLPLLADYALYLAAGAHRALDLTPQALATLSRLLEEHPDSRLAGPAARERANLYAAADMLPQAESAYRDYLDRESNAGLRREAMLELAHLLVKRENPAGAEELLRRLWVTWPESLEAARAGDLLASMAGAKPFTPDEQFERALGLYRAGQYGRAAEALAPFLAASSPHAVRARLFTGISRFHLREYARAITLLSPLADRPGPHRDEALYWIGRSHGRLDEPDKAVAAYRRLVATSPRSPWAADALYFTALNHIEDGKPAPAIAALSRLIREHPSSRFGDGALWTRAWLRYQQATLTRALHDLRHLHGRVRSASRLWAQSLYWKARVLEQLGKRREAAEAYGSLLAAPGDEYYYRQQAQHRLRQVGSGAEAVRAAARATIAAMTDDAHLSIPKTQPAAKARLLHGLSLRDEAAEEYWALAGRYADRPDVLEEVCGALLDLGRVERSVWIAKRLLRPMYLQSRSIEPVPRYWNFLYPLGYWDLVKEESARHEVDPFLVVAVIREESAFGERVVSRAGAVGLMQLLPKTADQIIKGDGASSPRPDLESPGTNIRLGTRYLATLLEEFKGNRAHALAAYNAGPHHVRRWLVTRQHRTDDEFIEEIPFTETQQYVKRVLGSYYRYRAQYGESEPVRTVGG